MTITFDVPSVPAGIRAIWESALPKVAAEWPAGRTGNVMLDASTTYYLQRTGAETLRLSVGPPPILPTGNQSGGPDSLRETYALLWSALFLAPDAEQEAVLASVESRLPRQCGCGSHWAQYKREHPPQFGAGFFGWLVAARNEIRRRQGKSTVTEAAARALYA